MTLEEVHELTEKILEADRHNGDPESAHHAQDRLYVAVLTATAAGHPDAAAMAAECLRIEKSDGSRWYA